MQAEHITPQSDIPEPVLLVLLWVAISTFMLLLIAARTYRLYRELREDKKKAQEPLIKNAPEVIYLQTGGCEPGDDFNQLSGVTWAKHRIHITDIKYRRDATRN